ncbi:MAG: MarR family transcriptional regulator [Gordonia sp. (in: high G+C Gram-positive bacteria)]|uniref:MarR family winged helix-turn-helix transcriptional regulator n=1 Tax=Gordonia sp. (in: high G+C Gram-positive bacteria) TaxID=84139 RepID=UPI0039E335BB
MIDQDRRDLLRGAIEDLYFGYRTFTALPDRLLSELGLGRTHHRILHFVGRDPGLSVGELLGVLEVSKQAVHRPLKDLDERGLIALTHDAADRRVRRLTLTPAGHALEARLTSVQMDLLSTAFDGLTETEIATWQQVMRRLARGE